MSFPAGAFRIFRQADHNPRRRGKGWLMDALQNLQPGDIVFVATPSFLYRKVARSTGTRASHVGIAFRDAQGGWRVAESAVPRTRYSTLERFLSRSDDKWFVIRRLDRPLAAAEVEKLRAACDKRMGTWYHLGFNYDSQRMFCSKFVHEVYREALGVEIGEVETFSALLHRNPGERLGFWKAWFFGFIPWMRRTVTPASQLNSPLLKTVLQSSAGKASPAANDGGKIAA